MTPLRLFCLILVMGLSACASRPGSDVLKTFHGQAAGNDKRVMIYAATTRGRQDPKQNIFTTQRAEATNYARFDIAIPPGHKEGQIEWPKGKPDPERSFTVVDQNLLTGPAFFGDIASRISHSAKTSKRIGVFVHGYNYSYQEGLFRMAQMVADTDLDGVPVFFSWPSQATLAGYLADRESVTYSRDYLASMLEGLTRTSGADEVMVFGHSMGGWLVMETLRQLKLEGKTQVLAKLRVILAAPDIDADVFRAQIGVIGKMPRPITILVSKDDRALKASSLLSADSRRVGALDVTDPEVREAAEHEGVRLVDISSVKASDGLNHDRYIGLTRVIPKIANREASLGQTGAFVLDTVGQTISSPFRLASHAINNGTPAF